MFLFDYSYGKYDDIKKRFALNSDTQVDAMYSYLIDATVIFLQQECSYETVAYGSLLQKAMNNSWTHLRDSLPIEIIARTMAYQVKTGLYNCESMAYVAYQNTKQANSLCNGYNMTDPNQMKFYVNATWYGDSSYRQTFQNKTKMTD